MKSVLITYLWITGVGATLVLMMPSIVLVGYMLFIVPGMLLGLLPTAFIYGALFAAIWFPIHSWVGEMPAAVASGVTTVAIAWTIPSYLNAVARRRLREQLAHDILPAERIILRGHILLQTARQNWDSWVARAALLEPRRPEHYASGVSFTGAAAALFFVDEVESITRVDGPLGPIEAAPPSAVTFSRVPGTECGLPLALDRKKLDLFGEPTGPAFMESVRALLAGDPCIAGSPARQTDYDFRLVVTEASYPRPHSLKALQKAHRRLGAGIVTVRRVEIFDGLGNVLLRHTVAGARQLARPLAYVTKGEMENFRFEWATAPGPKDEPRSPKPVTVFLEHTNLTLRYPPQ